MGCILSGVKMMLGIDGTVSWFFLFGGWVGFVDVSCSMYFGNSYFSCLLTWVGCWGFKGDSDVAFMVFWRACRLDGGFGWVM